MTMTSLTTTTQVNNVIAF